MDNKGMQNTAETVSPPCSASFSLLATAVLHYERLAVGALILGRALLVSSDMDFVE